MAPSPQADPSDGAVLIVEDDEDMRDTLAAVLSLIGVKSRICVGSLAELESRADDALGCRLAILDVNLGAGSPSGVDVYGWLEKHGFTGRRVFLTGHARSHPLVASARGFAGATVLSKPIDFEQMRRLLEEVFT